MNITKLLEWTRIVLVSLGFLLAYWRPPSEGAFWLTALMVIPLTGLTAIESLFFTNKAAKAKQWTEGSPYQIQSAMNNLATALTAMVILVLRFNQAAQVTVCLVALFFFALSSLNHLRAYFINKSVGIHLQRFIFTIGLWAFSLPILYKAMLAH